MQKAEVLTQWITKYNDRQDKKYYKNQYEIKTASKVLAVFDALRLRRIETNY